MTQFATEFPIQPIQDRAAFVAQVVRWLRGSKYSTVLDDPRDTDLEGDATYLRSQAGEELRLRQLRDGNLGAIGFRHDYPDQGGRLWRTEAVLRRAIANDGQDLIRLRTQCIAREPGARLETPRKPYLIKTVLRDGWGGQDGALSVSDQPLWLANDERALEIACAVTLGEASQHLPVIYVSATVASKWLILPSQVEKLAFDTGGVAHVVVEPDRAFSFQLRDLTKGANAYGGTIGIALPQRGIVRRFYLGWRLPELDDLLVSVRLAVLSMRSQMPAMGWDWTELQEQALRLQRERDHDRLSAAETEKLYEEEFDNLQDRIRQLEGQLATRPPEEATETDEGLLPDSLMKRVGREIYSGEFSDRLRLAVKVCAAQADQIGLDPRSKAVLEAIIENLRPSAALFELIEDLKRATKDPKRLATELMALLCRHGFQLKSEKKHIRLEPSDGYAGLESITLPKTPSDYRGSKNLRKQIERALGLIKLL